MLNETGPPNFLSQALDGRESQVLGGPPLTFKHCHTVTLVQRTESQVLGGDQLQLTQSSCYTVSFCYRATGVRWRPASNAVLQGFALVYLRIHCN